MPITEKDEDIYSREFWLFIGALVLTVACAQIIASTSIPVFNKIFVRKWRHRWNLFSITTSGSLALQSS